MPDWTGFRIPWTGTVHGQPALLVELSPEGGGTLAYTYHVSKVPSGASSSWRRDLRLLMPAKGAFTRPLAWRLRLEGGDGTTSEVAVATAEGTVRAELVTVGSSLRSRWTRTASRSPTWRRQPMAPSGRTKPTTS
jgi:hypothetical protein